MSVKPCSVLCDMCFSKARQKKCWWKMGSKMGKWSANWGIRLVQYFFHWCHKLWKVMIERRQFPYPDREKEKGRQIFERQFWYCNWWFDLYYGIVWHQSLLCRTTIAKRSIKITYNLFLLLLSNKEKPPICRVFHCWLFQQCFRNVWNQFLSRWICLDLWKV